MTKQLTIADIVGKNGDYKTIFSVETATERRFVHILGYAYISDDLTFAPYRFLEYTYFYIPLDDVLKNGLWQTEAEQAEEYKQYTTDIQEDAILDIYNKYDDGSPVQILTKLTKDTPDGMYILENY